MTINRIEVRRYVVGQLETRWQYHSNSMQAWVRDEKLWGAELDKTELQLAEGRNWTSMFDVGVWATVT